MLLLNIWDLENPPGSSCWFNFEDMTEKAISENALKYLLLQIHEFGGKYVVNNHFVERKRILKSQTIIYNKNANTVSLQGLQ